MPFRGDAGTALLHIARETLGQHRARAARDTTTYQDWWPLGRPEVEEAGGDTDPAGTEVGPDQLHAPLRVPRTSVVESFDHTEELRRAVFSVLPESMSRVGTPEKSAVDAFTAVHSIAGALHRAMAGGYLSVPFNTGGGATEFVELSTVFHDVELVTEEDGTPRVDWMIHIDTEDVNVDNVAHRHSGSDVVSLSAAALLGTGAGQFGSTVSVPALGGSRSVGVSDPGQQAGSVTLHKVKLEEPTVVLAGRTLTTVRGRGGRAETAEGTARVRILLQDAVRLGLVDPRQAPRAVVDGPHAGNVELHARTSPDRRLRFAPVLGSWLPQLSRVDSVDHDDAGRLMERVMRAVRAAAPDMLPPEERQENPPANRLVALARSVRGAKAHEYTNFMTLTNLVRPEPLAARLHDIVNGGVSVVLSRPGLTGPQEVVLTLAGTLNPGDFTHQGMWDGNSETYYGGFYELQGDRSTASSVEGGFDVPLNYTSTPDQFAFRGVGGRVAPRVGTGWVSTTGGGFSVGGASGGGSRFMAGFEGAVDVRVTVSRSGRPAPAPAPAPVQAPVVVTDGGNTVELTTIRSTTGAPAQGTDLGVVEEGRVGEDVLGPVALKLRLMVADDLLQEWGPDGRWHDSVGMRSHLDPDTRMASRELDPNQQRLVYEPGENERPPLHTLFMADTSRMHTEVDGLLTDLDVDLEPSERVGLHTALNAMGSRVEDFIGASRPFWTRTVGRDTFGMPVRLELRLQAIVKEMTTRGVSQTSYQYDHTLTTASVSDSATRDLISWSGSLGANASFTSDPRPQGYGGTAEERNAATHNSHTPTAGYRYGEGTPRTVTVSAEGQSDRVDIVLGDQEHIYARMEYRLVATRSSRSPVPLGTDPATARAYRQRTANRTIEDAHALLVMPAGRAQRMRARGHERAAERAQAAVPGPSRLPEVPFITADGLFPTTHPADGLGHAVLYDIPDFTPVVERTRRTLFQQLDADHAELVLTRLRAALGTRQGTKAAMEPMASGVFRIVVPYRGAVSTALAVVTAKVDLSNPVHTGDADTLHVIEGKNVRREDVSYSTSSSWSHSGNAGWNYGHTLHDQTQPVVDGGGGGGFGAAYGQGRSLSSSFGQTRSSGLLHVDTPALVAYDVRVTISLDHYWGVTASTGVVGPVVSLVGRHTRHQLVDANLRGGLTLAHSQQLMQPEPPTGPGRRRPRAIPAHEAPARTGLRPVPEDLAESFIGTIGGLRELLAQAENLLEENASPALGSNTWHGARAHVESRLAAVFSMAFLHQRAVHLLGGGTLRVPLTVPGMFINQGLTLVLSLDHEDLRVTSMHGEGAGTITGSIVKDFRRSHRSVGGAVDAALRLTGSASLRSGMAPDGPDVLRPGVGVEVGRGRGTGQSGGGLSSMLESGDKSMGTLGVELDDRDQRRYTHLSVGQARWNIGLERSSGTGIGVQVTVEQDALTFFAPEERADQLLTLEPVLITEPLVGAQPPSRGLRGLMPGGWQTGSDSDRESDSDTESDTGQGQRTAGEPTEPNLPTDEVRDNRDRWLAAAPDPARLPDEAFQAYWNHLPTDTAGFVRAAAAARSLLAEQGRVTDPLTSTPFSALNADGRAARRLAVVFHGDSGLYRDPARRDEALVRALELLDDPAPVRPVTESSVEPEAVPDVVSTTGPDRDTLVDEAEFEGAEELSPVAAEALARLRRELPDSWKKRLVKASGLLDLPRARTEEEQVARHEAMVLTAAAVYDTPRETAALLDYHRAGQSGRGEPPARGTVLLTALDEVLRDLPVGQKPGGGGSRPDTDPAYEGIDTPGASGSGSDPLAVAGPVPVPEMSPTDWIRDRDARDEGLLFAPPAAFTASSLRQYGGAGTFDLPDGRLYGEIRGAIVRAVPAGLRDGVRRALDERFSVESFISELPQAIGDRLVLGLHVDGVYFEAAVRVRVGDWRQVTDPQGRRLPGTEEFLPLTVSWKREPRTRQLLESGESVGSSRTRAHGIGLPAAIVLNHTLGAIPHLSSAAALFSSVLAGYSAASTSTVSSGATTARYTKGTYRAVDFLYDVLFDVTVQGVGGSVAPRQHQDVLVGALVGRHDRRLLRSRPRPPQGVTHATSEWWQEPVPATHETGPQEVPALYAPATLHRRDVGTGLLRNALENLGQHRGRAARDTRAYQEWSPLGGPEEEAGGPDPAVTVVAPNQRDIPLRVPRTSVVESFDHTEALRRAVFSVLPESMSRVGTPEKAAVDAFTAVHSIAGALHRAMSGGYQSVPFSTGGGVVESVELSTEFRYVGLVAEEDGTPRVDWMIHIDTEDVNVDNVAHRHSGSDVVSLSAAALWGTGTGQFGSTVSVPALGGSRSVGVSDPGQQAGSVTLHKVKLEEPSVVVAGRTLTTVRGRGQEVPVQGTARVRILLQDAVRLGLVDGRFAPRATVDGPHAGNVELHARTSPGRRLRFAPVLDGWLPQLSRVDSVDHGDAGRLMERVVRAVRAAAPDMLPPEADVNGAKAHEYTNLMTISNLVRPEPLAARLHDIVNGGVSVVLSRPGLTGPQEVVLTLSGTLDPDDFTHRGMWDGNSETYYGGFYELQGDRSTASSVEGGFDVPLNYSSTPDQFTFRGAGGRIAPRVGTGWVSTTGGGFSVGGASGGGSRFMAGFEGAVDVHVTVSRSGRPAPAPVPVQQPVTVTDGGNVMELTTTRSTTGAPVQGADLDAAEEGRAGVDATAPVSLNVRLMVADDLLEEWGPDGQWHDSVGMRSHLDPDTRMASRVLGANPAQPPLVYVPGADERPPLHTLFMADTSGMHAAVEGLLTDLDVDLEPSERVGLHTALNAMGSRVEDFIGGSYPFWTRTVGRDTFGMPVRLELKLRAIVKEMTTRGVSQTSYQYDHTLTTASVSDSATRDLVNVSGSVGVNASFTSDPRPQGYGGTDDERNARTDNSHTPTAGYRYGAGTPRTVTVSAEGQSDRVDIVLGAQEHIYARMEYRLVATLSSRSPVPRGTDPATARTYGQRTANRTIEDAHALLVMPAGLAERMREQGQGRASAETAEPVAGPSRLSPVPSVTGGDGPFPTTHPADGLGHAVLHDIPDLRPVVEQARGTLFQQLDADHAELVLTRLRAALGTRQGAKAAMEPMASGVFRIVVPHRGAVSTALAVVTAKVDLSNPVHTGDTDTLHVLEGKNVRREDVSYSTSYSWSHSGNAGWNYGHALHDQTQPVVDGGGGVGVGAAYGQGRSLGSSFGQTRSSGLLHVEQSALVAYTVRVRISLDHYWGATASTGVVGPVVSLVGRRTRHTLVDTRLDEPLILAHSQQLMQPEPPTGPGRPAPRTIPAHRAGPRTGLRPVPEDLTESFIGTIGGLRELLAQAENLLEENVSPALGSNTWHGARAHLETRLAAVFSMAFMHQRAVHLLSGDTLRVPLTVPGMFINQGLTLVLSLDHDDLSVTSRHGEGAGTITGSIVKDFRRSHRSVGGAVDAALRVTGSASLRSGMAPDGPDVLRPGVGVDVGRGRGTGQSGGGLSSMLESGDKSMGTLGEDLADPDQRRYAHLSVGQARWNIGLERSDGTGAGIQVTVEQDALTFFAPEERAQQLLQLAPTDITEPLVGAQPPSRGLRGRLMPGGWQTGSVNDTETDTDQDPGTVTTQHPEPTGEPTQLNQPTTETLTDLRTDIQEQPGLQTDGVGQGGLSGQFSARSRGKRRATGEAGIEGSGVDVEREAADEEAEFEGADELSPLAAGALAQLRRELPDSWQERLVNASGLLDLPRAVTADERAARHEAMVLTAAAVYDTPRETEALLDHH
ncbi:hypothetical protein ACWD5V_42065, partial [Streptomyces sp. NPDC002523]